MPWRVLILWALFLARGTFYCVMFPLWEGWDEYAHFAALQHWAIAGTFPRLSDPISREVDESMRLTPLASELRWIGPPYLIHERWWALPGTEREERERLLHSLSPALARLPSNRPFISYEAQQAPLYYWLFSLPLRAAESWPLGSRVLLIRLLSMALASSAIPLAWLAARQVFERGPGPLLCAALFAAAPGFAIDASRVANDALAVPTATAFLWLMLRPRSSAIATGLVLGAGILTKAYLLPLIPMTVVCSFLRPRKPKAHLALTLAVALCLGGWWYGRNLLMGEPFSGWYDKAEPARALAAMTQINWFTTAHVVAKTFIWFGAWSFLTLRSWMYAMVEILALCGLVLAALGKTQKLRPIWILTGFYALAICYGSAVSWAVHRVPNLPGWYLWPIAAALSIAVAAGLRRVTPLVVAVLAALDLYGAAALLTPYYAGLVERNHADAGRFFESMGRLNVPFSLAIIWIAATIAVPVIALWRTADIRET